MIRYSLDAGRFFAGTLFFVLVALPLSRAALPSDGEVIEGSAVFSGDRLHRVIDQESDRVVIEWGDFSVGEGKGVTFHQPGSGSAALNRVVGGHVSEIHGELAANGKIYLVNSHGILVGPTGVVKTGSFIASTLDVDNADFMAGGDLEFTGGAVGAAVRNFGEIRAVDGDVFLLAERVENRGDVAAVRGTAGMASAGRLLLRSSGDRRVSVLASPAVDPSEDDEASVWNAEAARIEAAAVELRAARGNHYALAINNEGLVRATTVESDGGRIFLRADSGEVRSSGTVDASGDRGGRVELAGDRVDIRDGGVVDASGTPTATRGRIDVSGGNLLLHGTVTSQGDMTFEAAENIAIGPGGVVDNSGGGALTLFVVDQAHPDRPGTGEGAFDNRGQVLPGNDLAVFAGDPRNVSLGNLESAVDRVVFDTWFGETKGLEGRTVYFKRVEPLTDRSVMPPYDLFDRLSGIYDAPGLQIPPTRTRYRADPEGDPPAPVLLEPGRLGETGLRSGQVFGGN